MVLKNYVNRFKKNKFGLHNFLFWGKVRVKILPQPQYIVFDIFLTNISCLFLFLVNDNDIIISLAAVYGKNK